MLPLINLATVQFTKQQWFSLHLKLSQELHPWGVNLHPF